ncbi:uncharacterized protein LOC114356849 [Ostrinia furnacalis]|uniref:uncharacterized protein LOC114356849 n=1 Tax=Ostrinia furnacalis TaxID=93504 RepID=UPI00103C04E7|nr:uncharacterized protein LOC114356849 [Ostrinia furnacalis]
MLTRKAAAQNTELKLKRALEELKSSQETCNQLIREREESEEDIQSIINKNTHLKKDLAELHTRYQEVSEHRDSLLHTISTFDQCSNVYEQALTRNHELEAELRDANKTIMHLEDDKKQQEFAHTLSLYDELIASPGGHEAASDMNLSCKTGHLGTRDQRFEFSSKNKLKKYIKINRYITKTKKLIKKQAVFYKNISLRKKRLDLIDSLEIYHDKLVEGRSNHASDVERLEADIGDLHKSLELLSSKYHSAQEQIKEHILAAYNLLQLSHQCQNHQEMLLYYQTV